MPLTAKERIELFGTRVFSQQLCKYIETKQEVGLDSIVAIFPDIKRKTIKNALDRLINKKIIEKNKGAYIFIGEVNYTVSKIDAVWRTVQILKTFKAEDIQRVTGFDLVSINKDLNAWLKNGDIIRIGKDGQKPIYKLLTISSAKPIGIYGRRKK
jgi:predicted transcriptional regulator